MHRFNWPVSGELNDLQLLIAQLYSSGTGTRLELRFKDAHFSPAFPEGADPDRRRVRRAANVLDVQQLVLTTEREEVGEERVEVRFGTQVEDLGIVGVVYVREDAQELTVDMFDG